MKQALIALALCAGLLAFPTTALADSDKSHKHKKFSDHKHLKHERAHHNSRSERQLNRHQRQHRIAKYRYYNGHNFKKWQARRHYHARNHYRHYPIKQHRHSLRHRHSSHDKDYLEWVAIMLLLDQALEDDYR
ncbi:MAG: hypothetical protein P8H31_03005 [Porticoccaceae bacterium]|nr:hypothetical protein [Porticoccaceae bacterium]